MTNAKPRFFVGTHLHSNSGVTVQYQVEYPYTGIGAVYQGHALIDGKRVRFVHGVLPWGLWVLRPRNRIRREVIETLEFSSIVKMVATANEA